MRNASPRKFQERGGVFVTVQDTGGTFGLLTDPGQRAWAGGIGALAKTAAQEWPAAEIKAIDIAVGQQSPIAVAEHLAQEILAGGVELEVGLGSTHGRVTVVADAGQVATRRRRIDQRDVIVVSGGARGVTAASVIALAKETQASFVLIGRTELGDEPAEAHGLTTDAELKRALLAAAAAQGLKLTPKELEQQVQRILADREVRATLAALTAAGSRVRYAAADVRDASQLGCSAGQRASRVRAHHGTGARCRRVGRRAVAQEDAGRIRPRLRDKGRRPVRAAGRDGHRRAQAGLPVLVGGRAQRQRRPKRLRDGKRDTEQGGLGRADTSRPGLSGAGIGLGPMGFRHGDARPQGDVRVSGHLADPARRRRTGIRPGSARRRRPTAPR